MLASRCFMSLRSLRRQLARLSLSVGVRRCACGAHLAPELYQPPRIQIKEAYSVPASLVGLLPLATPAEARELQALLNRCLELRPDLSGLRGTSHRIVGADPSTSPVLRFQFAERDDGPRCPKCGAAVVVDYAVSCVGLLAPVPADLLDALKPEPRLARYEELTALLRHRAGPPKAPSAALHK
jgi:hypothetical protein